MSDACVNPYGCEWSIGYFWRLMTWLGRLDLILLALLLAYSLLAVIRVSYRCHIARRDPQIDNAKRRKLTAQLSTEGNSLRSIASIAPYLGLVGTCQGIMNSFPGVGMEKHAALALYSSLLAAALATTAGGTIVSVAATSSYNYLRRRLELLANEAQRFPLAKRFSQVPGFAQIAAPALALCITVFMIFRSPGSPNGMAVRLLGVGSVDQRNLDRVNSVSIGLLDTIEGPPTVFVNSRPTSQNKIRDVLQASLQPGRIVTVAADKEVRWQDVVTAIDVAEGLDCDVILLTARPIRYSRHNW